jgi:hypothetical protein
VESKASHGTVDGSLKDDLLKTILAEFESSEVRSNLTANRGSISGPSLARSHHAQVEADRTQPGRLKSGGKTIVIEGQVDDRLTVLGELGWRSNAP